MRWTLVGASTIATGHKACALLLADQNVVTVHSHAARQAGEFGQKRGIAGSVTALDAIPLQDRSEAAHISSTNEKHHARAMATIAAGTHVLCEQPLAMPSGAMVMGPEGYTRPFAGSGLAPHGAEGSTFATGLMTRQSVRQVVQVAAAGREAVAWPAHDLCGRAVQDFLSSVAGRGRPATDGREAARTGRRQMVQDAEAA